MKISEYLKIFRTLSYPQLFSSKCLNALKNIQQSSYGELDTHIAIHEIRLSEPDFTDDVSFCIRDNFMKRHWLEFDFQNYSSGEELLPCTFLTPEVFKDHEVLNKVFGQEKLERFRKAIDNLRTLLENNEIRPAYLGELSGRGGNFSDSIRIEVTITALQKALELLKSLHYSGDIALFENTFAEFEPYASVNNVFLLSFEMFPDGRIYDKVGITFGAQGSLSFTKRLVDFLVKKDYCCPEQAEAIIKWRSDELPKGIFIQELCHAKVQFEKGKIVAVKLYLRHLDALPFIFSFS